MKKNKLSLISLLVSTTLMVACGGKVSSTQSVIPNSDSNAAPENSSESAPIYGSEDDNSSTPNLSSEQISSSINNSSSEQPVIEADSLDYKIQQFLTGLDVNAPLVNDYALEYSVIYYYAYQTYMINMMGEDADGEVLADYLSQFTSDTNLTSQNDDDWYPVAEYGYLYSDAEGYAVFNFYDDEGIFYLSITRNDGVAGMLDVSGVDTNWYVDYVNFQGLEVLTSFPEELIKNHLSLNTTFTIPAFSASYYPSLAGEEYIDEDGNYYPASFYLVLQGNQVASYADILEKAGYVVSVKENTEQTIDWETFEIVDYTYYTASAYDIANDIYISLTPDNSENTIVIFSKLSETYCLSRSAYTDWFDAEKDLMNNTLHQVLPYMAFGAEYMFYDDSDDDWNVLILVDNYFEDLSDEYIALLIKDGFEEYDDPDYGLLYRYDNGFVYIEIFVYYEGGNCLEIYFEDSKLPALTSLGLNETSLDIVAGASYQLEAQYNPSNATHPVNWSSSNNEVATVDDNGLVTIVQNASAGATVTITAKTPSGLSASCVFTIAANTVTGVKFTQDNYNVIAGGKQIQTQYTVLPVGATTNPSDVISYGFKDDGNDHTGIHINENGIVYADDNAVAGKVATISISINGTLFGYATVTVMEANVTHTLDRDFFDIQKANYSKYLDYSATKDGATYAASCAGNNGIQIRSKNDPSGVIGHYEGRACQSITFNFDASTQATSERKIDIYASNSAFTIADMFNSSVTKVGSIVFDANNLTQTYTFTSEYSYIGFRSNNGAIYLSSVVVVW